MATISWPFDSTITQDENGNPVYSKAYSADVLAGFLKKYFRDGVFASPSDNLMVSAGNGMTVSVAAGWANVQGRQYWQDAAEMVRLEAADAKQPRVDTVALRLDLSASVQNVSLVAIKGTAAAAPQAPGLTRNATVWELALADVRVSAGTSEITALMITDARLDTSRCGLVTPSMGEFDTSRLYQQMAAALSDYQKRCDSSVSDWNERARETMDILNGLVDTLDAEYRKHIAEYDSTAIAAQAAIDATAQANEAERLAQFDAWFAACEKTLDGDVAGNLLNLINRKAEVLEASVTLNGGGAYRIANGMMPPAGDFGISGDGMYLAVTGREEPYMHMYKRGEDGYVRLGDPDVQPEFIPQYYAFSNDGAYLAVAGNTARTGHSTLVHVKFYKREGDAFLVQDDPPDQPNNIMGLAISSDGMRVVYSSTYTPYLGGFKYVPEGIDLGFSPYDPLTFGSNITPVPKNTVKHLSMSGDGLTVCVQYLGDDCRGFVVYRDTSSYGDGVYRNLFQMDSGNSTNAVACALSGDGSILAYLYKNLPDVMEGCLAVEIYEWSIDTYVVTENFWVADKDASYDSDVMLSEDGKVLDVSLYDYAPYMRLFKREANGFVALDRPRGLPEKTCERIRMMADGSRVLAKFKDETALMELERQTGSYWNAGKQTVSMPGMLATDNPIASAEQSDDVDVARVQVAAFQQIHRYKAGDGMLTAMGYDGTPEEDVTVRLTCIRR